MKAFRHFKTITYHKILVMQYCFRVGLIRQGLLHDLSKYSWAEFRVGAKYYSGTSSPNATERMVLGYSTAWLHHKGRNKHHLEYWMDYAGTDFHMEGQPMPTKYMVELCLDRISACRVYHGKSYSDQDPLEYLNHGRDAGLMHSQTRQQVVEILTILAQQGEKEMLRYIRNVVLKDPVKYYVNTPTADVPPEKKDPMFLSQEDLLTITDSLETPFYLYSESEIRNNCEAVRKAFAWDPNHRQFFPVKAAPTPGILRLLCEMGEGVVCSSGVELKLCHKCGFSPNDILFMPNYPLSSDLDVAAEIGCRVMLDGPDLVEDFAQRGLLQDSIGLRINPGSVFRFGKSEVRLDASKFGFTPQTARDCIKALQRYGIKKIGIHSYLAGNTLESDYYPQAARTLLHLAQTLQEETGIEITYVNISGGIGIPYRPEDKALNILAVGKAVHQVWAEYPKLRKAAVHTELGRFITGPAGILVTRVTHIRESFRRYASVDASASDLMRPMLYGAYHHITVMGAPLDAERMSWDVVGPICENTDKFAENRLLPPMHVGDVLAVHDAGAHGHSMGYQYGGRLRCAEYMLMLDGSVQKLRRAETSEDYFMTMVF